MNYNCFYVDKCESKEVSNQFLRCLVAYSDAFSLVYFRYRENEKLSSGTLKIYKRLSPFVLDSRLVTEWPGTIVRNEQSHIYQLVTYRVSFEVLPVLERVKTLWDWCYPKFPMDPCFYKNGYAWFEMCTHEHWNQLYLAEDASFPIASDLESLGVSLIPKGKKTSSDLFFNDYLEKRKC